MSTLSTETTETAVNEAIDEGGEDPHRPVQGRWRRRVSPLGVLLRLMVPVGMLGVWWAASKTEIGQLFIADPFTVVARLFTDYLSASPSRAFLGDVTIRHVIPSLVRSTVGFFLALVIGVGTGILLGLWPKVAAMFMPLIHLGRSLPTTALLGVFFFMFGTGDLPKVLLIAFGVVWPILFNTIDGVQSLGTARGQVAAVFRIPSWDVLTRIVLPGAAPKIFAGVRVAISLSLILMIISELQKSANGMGYQLILSQRNFDFVAFWAVLTVLAVVGIVINIVFNLIERRVLAWHRGATATND